MAMGQRLKFARTAKRLSQAALAELTTEKSGREVSQGTISAIENRDTSSSELTPFFADALGISYMWLATGLGDMMASGLLASAGRTSSPSKPGEGLLASANLTVGSENQFFDVPYFKNTPHSEDSTHKLSFRREWLERMELDPINLVVVPCRGDSMGPRIRDGDVVLINKDVQMLEDGGIYAINYGGEARIKRLIKRFDGSLIIRSDNKSPEYTDEIVTEDMADQLKIIGKAVWVAGNL